MLEGINTKK